MAIPTPVSGAEPEPELTEPRWGLGDAAVGWVLSFVAAAVWVTMLLLATGNTDPEDVPLWLTAVGNLPLWMGFLFVPIWAATVKGNGWVRDFHVSLRWTDVPLGIVAGLVAQFLVVPLLSWPVLLLSGKTADDLAEPAQELADKATNGPSILIFFLMVGIIAPIAEELFFRGLLYRSLQKRWSTVVALVGSSVLFGATHFQPLQFLPLVGAGLVFGGLVARTDRLGPSVVAHMAFNTATVVSLVWIAK